MKYLSLILLTSYTFLSAMEQDNQLITLPSKEVLLKRLEPIKEYSHFIDNTTFIDKFAGKNKYAAEVFMILGFDLESYHECFKNNRQSFYLEMLKPKVVTLMLQDYPHAITFLKENGILTEPVTLPCKDTLHTYLINAKYDHVAKKTKLIQQLANTQKYPTEIFMIIHCQMLEYIKKLENKPTAKAYLALIPYITKTILQKHPNAIQFLINEDLLDS